METLAIVIPTYNEKDNICNIITTIGESITGLDMNVNVIVVDDNSPDKTADILENEIGKIEGKFKFLKINIIRREGKLGLGTAYIRGFKEAIKYNADYIMEMDADFSHQPKYIKNFLIEVKNADLVIGSRYVKGGTVENWGIIRKIISKGGSLYARTILGLKIRDLTGGYNLYRKNVLEKIDLDGIKSNGYSFQIELKYRTYKKGFIIKEIPITFPDRTVGKSKMSKKIFLEALIMVFKMRKEVK
ncbi:MAG: polyprenol monophosphomannose synthase [bacterium]